MYKQQKEQRTTRMALSIPPLCTTAAAVLFLLSNGALATSSPSATAPHRVPADPETGLVSFPLVPDHVHRRRLGLSKEQLENEQTYNGLRRQRNLQNNDPHQTMAGLYLGYGTHYVDLYCGTPPQRQTVIVDTGSSQTAFPCSACTDCGANYYHAGPLFDERKSSTFEPHNCNTCSQRADCEEDTDQCTFAQYYSEGSNWKAFEAIDTCYIGGFHNKPVTSDNNNPDAIDPNHAPAFAFDMLFGCQTKITGLFKTQLADGILGMSNKKTAFWHQMFRAHKIRQKQFSLCYTRPPHALRKGSEAGAITLGGTDERLHDKSPMVYTTLVGTSSEFTDDEEYDEEDDKYYDIHVREMYLREGKAGESAMSADESATTIKLVGAGMINDEGGVIVDSGTTDTYLSKVIHKQLSKDWAKLAGIEWSHKKLDLTPDEIAKLPTLLIQFAGDVEMNKEVARLHGGGDPNKIAGLAGDLDKNYPYDVVVAIPASQYMEGEDSVTNRIYATEMDGSVLGANALLGHDVLFDGQNKRIGWAESSCDYMGLVERSGYESPMIANTESVEEIQQEDEQYQQQEASKETYDQENTEEEIESDNENIEDFVAKGGTVEWFRGKNIPVDSAIENPEIAGIVVALVFLGLVFCICRCCCSPAAKKRRRSKQQKEIEFWTRTRSSYRDNFEDELDHDDGEYGYDTDRLRQRMR